MIIRTATPEDIDAIHALGEHVSEFSVNDETVTFWPKALLAGAVRSDDVLMLVAEEQGICGFLIVNCNRGLKKALIENIYVHPDVRGQGVGDQLLQKMFAVLSETDCEYAVSYTHLTLPTNREV